MTLRDHHLTVHTHRISRVGRQRWAWQARVDGKTYASGRAGSHDAAILAANHAHTQWAIGKMARDIHAIGIQLGLIDKPLPEDPTGNTTLEMK